MSFDGSGPNGTAQRGQGIQAKILRPCRSIPTFQRYFRPLDLDGGFVYAPPRRKTNLFILLMILLYHKCEYETRYCAPPKPIHYMTNTHHVPLHYPTFMVHKQDSTRKLECQLTKPASFDNLLDKSHSETDSDDARADDLTRRRSNKRPKTKSIQKAAERDRGRTPKRLSGRLCDRSALDFSFSFVCGAGVCLSRRAQRADLYKTSTRYGAKEPDRIPRLFDITCKLFK